MASGLVAISYGVLARPVLGAGPTVVSSVVIFAGSAQSAMLAVLSAEADQPRRFSPACC